MRAAAATPLRPQVTVDVQPCGDVRARDVYHVVAVELEAQLVVAQQATPGTTRVTIQCRGAVADIVVLDPTTGKTVARSIDLARAPALGRARLLALATVELVSASWAELELGSRATTARSLGVRASPREQAAARSSAERRDARDDHDGSVRLGLAPYVMVPTSAAPVIAGATVRVARASDGVGWSVDFTGARGVLSERLGDVSLLTIALGAGIGWRAGFHSWSLTAELGGRLGGAWWAGEARDPSRVEGEAFSAAFAALGVLGSLEYALSQRISLNLYLGAEQVVLPVYVRSAGTRAHGLDGIWLGMGLGSSFAF